MKSIAIVAPIEIQTTTGRKLPGKEGQFVSVSQLQFMLTMLAEPAFLDQLRGLSAAKFQAGAKSEIERSFGPDGDGMVSDGVATALNRAAERATFNIDVGGKDIGPGVTWCFLPFLQAIADARSVAPVAEQSAPEAAA
ncbi:MAG TPA: hypothetical protein VG734_25905 [Lacunisphaera sp.]|nr:hypothetical protein [Lacunisphaera sp.]